MDKLWNDVLWSQFTAAINMLEKPISTCPDALWETGLWNDPRAGTKFSSFWYVAYHCLFWLDLYLTGKVDGYMPPAPFDLNELDARGLLPDKKPTKNELLTYLDYCRHKCQEITSGLTDEKAHQPCEFPWSKGKISFMELLVDNMRHVQEHAAQLNMFLGQQAGMLANWVSRVKAEE